MTFKSIDQNILSRIREILGDEAVFADTESLEKYSKDETEDLRFSPEVVVKPKDTLEISSLLKYCNENNIAVTPRGGGTGLSGGALPIFGGVLLSLEKFNKIIDIDERNLQAAVEPGVITEVFMNEVELRGLYYPIDPSSKGSSFIGGNMAHGSGGPRVVKYGTLREYVLNFEVVLPNGEILWTGANTLKDASGYNLTQLFIGSEGTLGIITKIVVKLVAKPTQNLLMMASFPSDELACSAVSAIFRAGVTPSALEFMERKGVEWVTKFDGIHFIVEDNVEAYLLIEVDGNNLEVLFNDCDTINTVLEQFDCSDVLLAESSAQKDALWRIRRAMPLSVKSNSVYKEEDTVVPRAELPVLIRGIKAVGEKYGFDSVCYGHAGDGNLHVNIIKGDMSDDDWNYKLKDGIKEIFELTVSLGGTISGEHGIGLVQKDYMAIKYSNLHMDLMRGIKKVFDPRGIMNPGKIF